ncbi:melanoma-associated antigen B3-like [Elephas maximus indicus]|uniref:melanoma-associated antigen B3-like n=1 Tax=Elephas maximus indicus TaxID=99487 RepID=UPI002116B9E7|nr:melanoma-associated antigen B3-like [Elephas maximus indicus]
MPHTQKSNLCVREKRQQKQGETKVLRGAQAMATAKEKFPSSSAPPFGCTTQRKPGAKSRSTLQGPQRALSTLTTSPGASRTRSYAGAKSKGKKRRSSSQDQPSTKRSRRDPLTEKVGTLVQFLVQKYKMKKLVMKKDMLKIVNKKYKKRFLEILRRASFSMEVVFGIALKEIDSIKHSYALVSKMDLPNNGRLNCGRGLPKTGLLMILLGVIFMKGNCASEEKIWEFLNKMKIFAGKRHFMFGEPRKLITQDFVKLKYLEYRQVPNSDPPSYEFLWGPRAHAETSKMKILEFLAKINDTVPSALPSLYEEALRDEEERARATVPDRADPTATASVVRAPVPGPAAPPRPSEAAPLLLTFPRGLREPHPRTLLLQVLRVQELMGNGLRKNGLLRPLLGVIYRNGNRATVVEIWKLLNVLGIYDRWGHFIDGEPRKLLTKDLVQEKYLEYQQVPNSDPPSYEFLKCRKVAAPALGVVAHHQRRVEAQDWSGVQVGNLNVS